MLRPVRGSLLIQVGIALLVIMLLVSLSIPTVTTLRRFIVRTETEKLYSLFHYMQQQALAQGKDQTLIFDVQHNSINGTLVKEKLSSSVIFGYILGSYGPPSQPTKIIHTPITFKNNQVTFADGTISSGTIYLTDQDHRSMYALTSPISQISFIRLYHYKNGSWILLQ